MESDVKTETKFENFDYETYFKNNPIAHSNQNRFEKSRELLKDPTLFKGKLRFVERVEYGECDECHAPIKLSDYWRGELVCKGCGLVMNDHMATLPDHELMQHTSTDKLETGSKVTDNERRALKRAGKVVIEHTDKSEWRKASYILEIDIISSQLMMTRQQKQIVREILETHKLREFHRRLNSKAIIAGICRYVLVKHNRVKELRYNREPFVSVGLDKQGYKVIERRLNAMSDLRI